MDRDSFVLENLILVKAIVGKIYSSVKNLGFEYDDLYQAGVLALLECCDRYDSNLGAVSTFIFSQVNGAVLNYIRYNSTFVHVPYLKKYFSMSLNKYRKTFYRINGRNPSIDELLLYAKENINPKLTENDIEDLIYVSKYCFNDKRLEITQYYEIQNSDDIDNDIEYVLLEELIEDSKDLEKDVTDKMTYEDIVNYIESIVSNNKNFDLFMEFYGLYDDTPKTFRSIGEKYNVTGECIRQKVRRIEKELQSKKEKIKKKFYE